MRAPRRAAGMAAAALLLACLQASAAGEEAPPEDARFLGVLLPQLEVRLAPRIDGELQQILVRIGDRVAEGALMARIDARPIRDEQAVVAGRLEEARAEESEASTRLLMARQALERQRALGEQQIVSAEQLGEAERQEELARASLDRARAKVRQQQASVEQLERRLADAEIVAPFAGRVAELLAAPGASVGPERPVLRLVSDGKLWVRFAVPVDPARALPVDAPVRVVTGAGVEMTGSVKHVGPAVDPASGMVIYEALVETPADLEGPPLAGQAVRVRPDGPER